jgi:hypothetical protein
MNCLQRQFLAILLICAAALLAGCITASHSEARVPTELHEPARSFRLKEPSNRYYEARRVRSLLPTCPVTFERNIGTGEIVARDYSKPSYPLTRDDIVKLLGKPASLEADSYDYLVLERSSDRTFLSVKFENEFAVESSLYGDPK